MSLAKMSLDSPPDPGVKNALNFWGHLSVGKRNYLNIRLKLMLSGTSFPVWSETAFFNCGSVALVLSRCVRLCVPSFKTANTGEFSLLCYAQKLVFYYWGQDPGVLVTVG